MSKHSTGPWKWTGTGYILGGPEGRNAICEPFGREADARLIAAAPTLLAACKAMIGELDITGRVRESSVNVRSARYAIAAAEA